MSSPRYIRGLFVINYFTCMPRSPREFLWLEKMCCATSRTCKCSYSSYLKEKKTAVTLVNGAPMSQNHTQKLAVRNNSTRVKRSEFRKYLENWEVTGRDSYKGNIYIYASFRLYTIYGFHTPQLVLNRLVDASHFP